MTKLAPIGPHIQAGVARHIELLRKWQPAVVTVIDPGADVGKLKEVCPETKVLGRIYVPESELTERIRKDGPKATAKWADYLTMSRMVDGVDWWQIANEIMQTTAEDLDLLSSFEAHRMVQGQQNGYKCGILGFSVGNPDLPNGDHMGMWKHVYGAMAGAIMHDGVLVIHQYGKPNVFRPDPEYFVLRYETKVYPFLPAELKDIKTVVAETGVDNMIWSDAGPSGWQNSTDVPRYVTELVRLGDNPLKADANVLGSDVFTLGHYSPWQTYDIDGEVANRLASTYELRRREDPFEPGPDPKPPVVTPPVEGKLSRSYDAARLQHKPGRKYQLLDFFTTRDGRFYPGQSVWDIERWAVEKYDKPEFHDKGGSTHLFALVLDKQGNPVERMVRYQTTDGQNTYDVLTDDQRGYWCNMFMAASSAYWPEEEQRGPWAWGPKEDPESWLIGGGLVNRWHISMFGVWQEIDESQTKPPPPPPPEPNGKVTTLLIPLAGSPTMTQMFGARYDHYMQLYGVPGHNGVDWAAPTGTSIYAAAEGKVAWVGLDDGYGKYVRLWHPELNICTFYAHMDVVEAIKNGDTIKRGQVIGDVGSTGNSTGPHLHYEIRLTDDWGNYVPSPLYGHARGRVDPLSWMETQARVAPAQP